MPDSQAIPPRAPQALTAAQARGAQQAAAWLQAGRADQALALARRITAEAPRAPDAQQTLAMCLAATGDGAGAEQAFRRALALAPDHPLILINYSTLLRQSGRRDDALAACQRAADKAPRMADAWIALGRCALETGDAARACQALERAVALKPDSAPAWHALGRARRAVDDLPGAEAALRKTVALAPATGSAWVNLGTVCRLLGRAAEALACYRRAGETGLHSPELSGALTGILTDLGRFDQAMAQARKTTRDFPAFAPGFETLADLLWEHGPVLAPGEDPLDTFRAAVAAQPDNQALKLALARFLVEARKPGEALETIRELRAADDNWGLAVLEANALEALGEYERSGALYRQAYHTPGGRSPAMLNAWVRHLLRAGDWQQAAQRADEAVHIAPADQEAWAYLATAWRLLDDEREFWLCDYGRLITLIEVEPPAPFKHLPAFLEALEIALEPLHRAGREPVRQSLRGGSQTPGRLFGRPDPTIAAAEKVLKRSVEHWLSTLPDDAEHPFLNRKAARIRFSGSWSVKLWSSGSHVNHIHSQGWMSSAFYVCLPSSVRAPTNEGSNAGYIQFGQPPAELGLNLPPRRVIRPEPGHLALFPSYMWHGTVPFEDEAPRITIAFDMLPAEQPT